MATNVCVFIFQSSVLFCCMFCTSTTLFFLLWLWSIIWFDTSSITHFCSGLLWLFASFMLHLIDFSIFVKNDIGILMSISLNLYIDFSSMGIFKMLILSIHKYGRSLQLLVGVFFYFFLQGFIVFIIDIFISLVKLIPRYFIANGIVFPISFSACSLLVYRKATVLCMLIFLSCYFAKSVHQIWVFGGVFGVF
jgi:hypothetical protein